MHFKVFVVAEQGTNVDELLEQYYEGDNFSFIEENIERIIEQERIPVVKRSSLSAGQKQFLKSAHTYYQNLEWIPSYVFREYSSNTVLPANEVFIGEEGVRCFALDYMCYEERDGKYGCEINPKALYDGYVLGGRWKYEIPICSEGVQTTQELSKRFGEKTVLKTGKVHANMTQVKFIDWQFIRRQAEYELAEENLSYESEENGGSLSERVKQQAIDEKIRQKFFPYIYINETGFIEKDGLNGLGEQISENGLSSNKMDDFIKEELMKEKNQDKLIYVFDFHI